MYKCQNCFISFEEPTTRYDDEDDEQYELCPKCDSDSLILINTDNESDETPIAQPGET